MEAFQEAHFFSMPSQGNVYSYTTFPLADGSTKLLQALLSQKVFCCGFERDESDVMQPVTTEIEFAHIPDGSEIVALDSFNRCPARNEVFIGIALTKKKEDGTIDYVLNIYSNPEPTPLEGPFDMDAVANNCVIIDLNYAPLHLSHVVSVTNGHNREMVFLLTGCDEQVHLYSEDRFNNVFCEADINESFAEYTKEPTIVLWLEVAYADNYEKRVSALACTCGSVRVLVAHSKTGVVVFRCVEYFEGPISRVVLFKAVPNYDDVNDGLKAYVKLIPTSPTRRRNEPFHLMVANPTYPSFVCMDVRENALRCKKKLQHSSNFDSVISACACDIDCDNTVELVVGTYSSIIFFYKYQDHGWSLIGKDRMSHAIHWIGYEDITGDGLKELIIATAAGIHVYQRRPDKALLLFNERFEALVDQYRSRIKP